MTFAATANAAAYLGAKPVFVDSAEDTLLLNPELIEAAITNKTKAIVTVDYAGQPSYYDALQAIADAHNIILISDACHALGGSDNNRTIGSLAALNTFSFHPVKPMTTGEGGMITTDSSEYAAAMRSFRNHCLSSDHRERQNEGSWFYEMHNLGYNYRLTDFQCALGMSQLKHVPAWTKRRQEIASAYDAALQNIPAVSPLNVRDNVFHAYHLYVVRLSTSQLSTDRAGIFKALRAENIGVNVHYIPVHLHPYYQKTFNTRPGLCPVAERAYEEIISLPIFPNMTDGDIADVVEAITKVCDHYQV